MTPLPYSREGEHPNPVYHVVPDNAQGGWNVYSTMSPQEPQRHFQSKQEALAWVEDKCRTEAVGYVVEEAEAKSRGTF